MNIIERLIRWTSRPPILFGLVALQILIYAGIAFNLNQLSEVSGGSGILDFEFGYSTEFVRSTFASYGTEGFGFYRTIQLLDLINPALYSTLIASIISVLLRSHPRRWAVFVPFTAGALDYVENGFLYFFATTFPNVPENLVPIASGLSVSKRAAIVLTVIALIYALFQRFTGGQRD